MKSRLISQSPQPFGFISRLGAHASPSSSPELRITFDDSLRPASSPPLTLSVLPTLRTLLLRNQIAKLLGRPLPKTQWRLVALLKSDGEGEEGPTVEIPTGEEGKDVGWWGLGDGDEVRVERV